MKKHVILAFTTICILSIGISNQASAHEQTYQVQAGDSLWEIASSHHLTVEQMMQYNQLTSSSIYVGQKLSLLAPHSHEQTASYTVQPGDTLWKIALSTGLTVTQLKTINNLSTNTIKAGQVLFLTEKEVPQPSLNADKLLTEAKKYIGVPYVWGGNTPSGFDCSGYLRYIYQTQGVTIPRTVAIIWGATTPVTSLSKGDLVFYATTAKSPTHAGIYIGDNKFIHAGSSTGVTITDMNNSYWKPRYLGARKVKI